LSIKILHGFLIGLSIILPGLSAGTVLLILGIYRQFLTDIGSLRLKSYWPLFTGILCGAFSGIYGVSYLLNIDSPYFYAFIFGLLISSAFVVIKSQPQNSFTFWHILFGISGFVIAWFIICEPTQRFTILPVGSYLHFLIGGILSSATMLIPGISGSSVLIIINLYEEAIRAFSSWQWLNIIYLVTGFIIGIFGLSRLLTAIYSRYQRSLTLLLAGLILGSTRALLPLPVSISILPVICFGALLVIVLSFGFKGPKKS